ncbi:hypothetical protein GGR58DRAFT_481951 [Xylaria digitata]|nr:hypothetical protein GGR58DRAFT_481951 [Xylaria digitata]
MLALGFGMKLAVLILVNSSASMLEHMCCGKSALSAARKYTRGQHSWQWRRAMIRRANLLFLPALEYDVNP